MDENPRSRKANKAHINRNISSVISQTMDSFVKES